MNKKPYVKALCVAASIFILDAVILNQGFIAVILILIALFVFFPIAVLLRRRGKRKYEQRLVKIAIYVLTGVAVLACKCTAKSGSRSPSDLDWKCLSGLSRKIPSI